MAGMEWRVSSVALSLLYFCEVVASQGHESPLNEEFGLNRHEELTLFSCLGAVMLMSVTIVLFLWYVVDRTKDHMRAFERHLPVVVRKFRHDIAAELEMENETARRIIMMTGGAVPIPRATVEPRPLEVRSGRISLTAYRPNQDVGVDTDLPGTCPVASRAVEAGEEGITAPAIEPTRKRSKAPDGADSKEFDYINGEYVPKDYVDDAQPSATPLYAYDNPAYDNIVYSTENGDCDRMKNNNRGKTKKEGKKDDKFATYESHV